MDLDEQPIIIDSGTFSTKASVLSNPNSISSFPTIVGRTRYYGCIIGMGVKDYYIGEEAESKRGILRIKYPLSVGTVINWDDMEKIWHHTFYNELRVAPEEHQILLSNPQNATKRDKEKITQIMFETFNAPMLCCKPQEELSFYATGLCDGIVVQCGQSGCSVVPIIDGNGLFQYKESVDINGKDMDDYFKSNLLKNDINIETATETKLISNQRQQLCYVSDDYSNESQHFKDQVYELPDEKQIKFGKEIIACPEALFNPSIFNLNDDGIHKATMKVISKLPDDCSKEIGYNVLLCGGNTMYKGINKRFENELSSLTNHSIQTLQLPNNTQNNHATVVGGSILASLPSFENICLNYQTYDEYGPTMSSVWGF